ncbi:LysM peptidoglycan-binding domain-containing protein [Endozoicomonas acroporae]|uniref:LysM peptidoglycan-binding domain-containing protein n=1 Tax=Endozoicomonas acroporae TaxID=1701104 RepID=UPI0015E0F788|nr:LysM peptidoglycan-binding domain-containing protein [Endozoicomonas acroporae]
MSSLGLAFDSPVKADSPSRYTVEKGDTLWDISTTFLDSPWLWPEIWHANPQIENPHLIYPGDVVSLVYINGQPRLMISSRGKPGRTIKLTPKIRVKPGESAIPAIPLSAVQSYLKGGHVFSSEEQLDNAPYVFAAKDGKLASGAGDKIYARGDFAGHNLRFDVVRRGQQIVDPETDEMLGLIGIDVGTINLSHVREGVASMVVQDSRMEMKPGDRVVSQDASGLVTTFFPRAPAAPLEGIVTASLNNTKKVSKFDTVVINKGERERLRQGDVLAVYRKTEEALDPFTNEQVTLPSERIGLVMVYRPFEKMSYGIVLSAKEDIEVGYILRSPQP